MTDLPLNTNLKRSRSSIIKNATNIQLHACLDEAKAYKDLVQHHFQQSKFQNHVLQTAQRFYKNKSEIRPSLSQSSFTRKMGSRTYSSSRLIKTSSYVSDNIKNPEFNMISALDYRANRVSQIKMNFQERIEQKDDLQRKIKNLKRMIVQEKNLKAKVSIRNCKLMNKAEQANYHINTLIEQSRRLQLNIREIEKENQQLEGNLDELSHKNSQLRSKIQAQQDKVSVYSQTVIQDRRELDKQRKLLEMTKEKQTIRYKQMTNRFMEANQLKQEKALLLNHIDVDLKNNQ